MNIENKDVESLVDPKNARLSILPIIYTHIWDMYKKHKSSNWVEDEIPYKDDIIDWKTKLDDDGRHFIKLTLAYFSASDLIVNENENKNNDEITILEVNFYIRSKMEREDTHSITYSSHLEVLVPDKEERLKLINAVETVPVIKEKAKWFRKYINNGTIVERIVSGAITEGIFFSSSFCSIYWLKKKGLMPALTFSNELISKDEGNHRDTYCLIYRTMIKNKLPKETVINMIKDAVILEQNFATEALPVKLVGMNIIEMKKYIEYVADHLSINLIGERIYNGENPFDWMDMISIDTKINFFDKKVPNYAETSLISNNEDNKIRFDAQF
jgi:ribonucleoside-diphosphate reductase beta chain